MKTNTAENLIQEDFYVDPASGKQRLTVIRPNRINLEGRDIFLELENESYKVLNLSAFGVAVSSPKEKRFKEQINGLLVYDDIEVAQLTLQMIRGQVDDGGEASLIFEIVGEPLKTDVILALQRSFDLIKDQEKEEQKVANIPVTFKHVVYEAKSWLESLEKKVNSLEEENVTYSTDFTYAEYKNAVATVFARYLNSKFLPIYKMLSDSLVGVDKSIVKQSFKFFRDTLGNLIYQAPYADRSYHKPRGYAGDYEMMNQTYKNSAIGKTLFAQCLHKYFVEEPAAKAVRNRGVYLKAKLKEIILRDGVNRKLKILSVACGPANELYELLQQYGKELPLVEFHFLDQDIDALKHTQYKMRNLKIKHNLHHEFYFSNLAIKNVIEHGLEISDYDLIYTAGLFDYFSSSVAQVTALKLFEGLKSGGQLIVGNFSINNPNKFGMELTLDWKLIYRTVQDMEDIFKITGAKPVIDEEELGINLFGSVIKP